MNDLPDETLVNIFSYLKPEELLTTISLVCQRWNTIHSYPSFYRNLTFLVDSPDTEILVEMLGMAIWLRKLVIKYRVDTDELLRQVGMNHSFLDTLIVHFCEGSHAIVGMEDQGVSGKELLNAITRCPSIQHLSLKDTRCTDAAIFYNEIGLKLPLLRTVIFGGNSAFPEVLSPDAFLNIARHCRLEEFRAPCTIISEEVISIFCGSLRETLRVLEINCAHCTNHYITSIATCHYLKELHILNANHISDQGIMALCNIPNLKELSLWCADRITSSGWRSFFQEPSIKSVNKLWLLYCEHLDNEAMTAISNMPNLFDLRISGSDRITASCWISCFETPSMMNIVNLCLEDCCYVDDNVVIAAVENLRCCKQIWFSQCDNITETGRNYISQQTSTKCTVS